MFLYWYGNVYLFNLIGLKNEKASLEDTTQRIQRDIDKLQIPKVSHHNFIFAMYDSIESSFFSLFY